MGKIITTIVAAAAMMVAASTSAIAQTPPAAAQAGGDSILSRAINDPSAGWTTYGPNQSARLVRDEAVQGGAAIRVTIRRAGANPWDDGANAALRAPIARGDRLVLAFWARASRLRNGETITLPFAGITEAQAPYGQILVGDATIGPEWALVEVRGTAASDHAVGRAQAALQLSVQPATIDLGPVFVLNLGQGR